LPHSLADLSSARPEGQDLRAGEEVPGPQRLVPSAIGEALSRRHSGIEDKGNAGLRCDPEVVEGGDPERLEFGSLVVAGGEPIAVEHTGAPEFSKQRTDNGGVLFELDPLEAESVELSSRVGAEAAQKVDRERRTLLL